VIGMLGLVDVLDRPPPGVRLVDGGRLVLIGTTEPELSGSAWARRKGRRGGRLPSLDLAVHAKVAGLVRELVGDDLVAGIHDVGAGGIGLTLAEMAVRSGLGFQAARIHDDAELFSESPSRVVACVRPEQLQVVLDRCEMAGVPATRIGVAGGDRLSIKGLLDVALADAVGVWRDRLPDALGAGTAQG